jgi:exopolysaccharide production protein ExoZ
MSIETGSASGTPHDPPATRHALQGLRGLAALLVVVDHAIIAGSDAGMLSPALRPFAVMVGLLGVYTFFVISGFVIALGQYSAFGRPGVSRDFLVRRIVRIVPLYWATTLIVCALRPELVSASALTKSLLFIPHEMMPSGKWWPIYALGWTLQYELYFYLLFAVALRFGRATGLALLMAAIGGLVLAGRIGLVPGGTVLGFYAEPIVLLFLVGTALGVWVRRSGSLKLRVQPVAILAAAAAVLGAACLVLLLLGRAGVLAYLGLAGAAIAATGLCVLPCEALKAVGRGALDRLGDATYSIYLTHSFVVFGLGAAASAWSLKPPFAVFLGICLVASLLVGLATYRWAERPAVRGLGRLVGQTPGIGGRVL